MLCSPCNCASRGMSFRAWMTHIGVIIKMKAKTILLGTIIPPKLILSLLLSLKGGCKFQHLFIKFCKNILMLFAISFFNWRSLNAILIGTVFRSRVFILISYFTINLCVAKFPLLLCLKSWCKFQPFVFGSMRASCWSLVKHIQYLIYLTNPCLYKFIFQSSAFIFILLNLCLY